MCRFFYFRPKIDLESAQSYIRSRLLEREQNSSLRQLRKTENLIDFCSNDYLGFAQSPVLHDLLKQEFLANGDHLTGSTGSRLISGNSTLTELLEAEIAAFHISGAALLFNSGYDANLGLFSALLQRGDTVILDELIHASIIDGCRLSFANKYTFRHNDLTSLEEKLKVAKGRVYIGIESIYSMDGDTAPLLEIVELAEKYDAALVVDEAHATGIFGAQGRGLVCRYGLENRVFARVITFGKALGCHGAAVLGDENLRQYLINFARSFIYTTAAAPLNHLAIRAAYQLLQESTAQEQLRQKILFFQSKLCSLTDSFIASDSAIQCLVVGGNEQTKILEKKIQQGGMDVRAILHPTVPAGKERLRICLHTFNTEDQIDNLINLIKNS